MGDQGYAYVKRSARKAQTIQRWPKSCPWQSVVWDFASSENQIGSRVRFEIKKLFNQHKLHLNNK